MRNLILDHFRDNSSHFIPFSEPNQQEAVYTRNNSIVQNLNEELYNWVGENKPSISTIGFLNMDTRGVSDSAEGVWMEKVAMRWRVGVNRGESATCAGVLEGRRREHHGHGRIVGSQSQSKESPHEKWGRKWRR
jgi:hypothetical protein